MSKTMDRIAALLAQAEGTDNEDEAAAYMQKAQQIATLAAVDIEIARQHQRDKTKREQPVQRKIEIAGRVGTGYGRVQNNAAEYCHLFMNIGRVNDVAFDVAHNSTYVIAYGMPSDIEVTEALYASLLQQMTQAALDAIARGEHKDDEPVEYWDDRTWTVKVRKPDARRFKTSFYQAFSSRVASRLRTAKNEALQARDEARSFDLDIDDAATPADLPKASGETALVLKGKEVEVQEFKRQTSNARGTYKGGQRSTTSNAGLSAGRAAGDRARLGAPRAIGNRTAIR